MCVGHTILSFFCLFATMAAVEAAESALTKLSEDRFWAMYTRGRTLGRGSFGTVYESRSLETGAAAAIKVVYKSGRASKDAVTKGCVEREAACWLPLYHPNIVRLLGAFEMEMAWSFPMELCPGGDLLDKITRDEHYSEDVARRFVRQLAEGIAHMHAQGVVHRDLKLENLMLSSREDDGDGVQVKLSDFDLACFFTDAASLAEPCGTPGYVAPEIIRLAMGDRSPVVTVACDIWSFGVIAYILLCGHPPFDMEDDDACSRATLAGDWSFPDDIWGDVSSDAKDVVSRMLVVDPAKRATITEILAHPWFHVGGLDVMQMPGAARRLSRLNSKWKWKAATKAIVAAAKFRNAAAIGRRAVPRRPSDVGAKAVASASTAAAPAAAAPTAPAATPQALPARRLSDLVAAAPALAQAVQQRDIVETRDSDELARREQEWRLFVAGFQVSSLLLESPLLSLGQHEKPSPKPKRPAWSAVRRPSSQQSPQQQQQSSPRGMRTMAEQRVFKTSVEDDISALIQDAARGAAADSLSESFASKPKASRGRLGNFLRRGKP